jgi:hypothetical protein
VRVKAGVRDPDFPDLDLGGWTATVLEVDAESEPANCQLLWTEETQGRIDPAVRARCEADGLDLETIWLYETDLEEDASRPVQNPATLPSLLQPPRPPGLDEQENRIRAALGVPVGADIPLVNEASLRAYFDYLTTRLVFPLESRELDDTEDEIGRVTLVGLPSFGDDPRYGLVAEIRRGEASDFVPLSTLSVEGPPEAHQLVEDYAFWFWSRHPLQDGSGGGMLFPAEGGARNPIWTAVRAAGAYGAACGAATGALRATVEFTDYGMYVGMALLGLAGWMAGSRFGRVFAAMNGIRFGHLYGALFGLMAGVLIGAAVGVMLVGALGTIPGAILFQLLGSALAARGIRPIGANSWTPLGACVGGLVFATWKNSERALYGALVGAGSGALLVVFVVMLLFVTMGLASRGAPR